MTATLETALQVLCRARRERRAEPPARPAADHHRPARVRRAVVRSGAARPARHGSAYRAGAPYVESIWGDEALQLARFAHAPAESFDQFSTVAAEGAGQARRSRPRDAVDLRQRPGSLRTSRWTGRRGCSAASSRALQPVSRADFAQPDELGGGCGRQPALGRQGLSRSRRRRRSDRLWDAIVRLCRLDRRRSDRGVADAHRRAGRAAPTSSTGSGTRAAVLRAGHRPARSACPSGHIWVSARSDEPERHRVRREHSDRGSVHDAAHAIAWTGSSARPSRSAMAGTLIEDFTLRFEEGRVVEVKAARGEAAMRQLLETDAGRRAARRSRARAAQLADCAVGCALLQHAVRRERGEPRRPRLGVQVHDRRRRGHERRGLRARGRQPQRDARGLHDRIRRRSTSMPSRADGAVEPLVRSGEWAAALS